MNCTTQNYNIYLCGNFLSLLVLFLLISRSGYTQEKKPGELKWKFETNGQIDSSPALGDDGTLFVGSNDDYLYALDSETGKLKWKLKTLNDVSTVSIGLNNQIYFHDYINIYSVDGNSGKLKWKLNPGYTINRILGINSNSRILAIVGDYFKSYLIVLEPEKAIIRRAIRYPDSMGHEIINENDNLISIISYRKNSGGLGLRSCAYETLNGQELWREDYPCSLFINNKDEILMYKDNETLRLNSNTGELVSKDKGDSRDHILSVYKNFYLCRNSDTDGFSVWDTDLKKVIWQNNWLTTTYPAISKSGTFYFGSTDEKIYAVDISTGEEKWSYKTGYKICSSPCIGNDGTVFIGSYDKYIYAIKGDSALADSSWPMYMNNSKHTNSTNSTLSEEAPLKYGDYKWQNIEEISIWSNPPVGYGKLFVGQGIIDIETGVLKDHYNGNVIGENYDVYAYPYQLTCSDINTGKLKWRKGASIYSFSKPAIGKDGTVFISARDKNVQPDQSYRLYAFEPDTGNKKWEFKPLDRAGNPSISPDGTIYLPTSADRVYGIDSKTGKQKWIFRPSISDLMGFDSEGNLLCFRGSELQLLDSVNHKPIWTVNTHFDVTWNPLILDEILSIQLGNIDSVFVYGYKRKLLEDLKNAYYELQAYNLSDGSLKWKKQMHRASSSGYSITLNGKIILIEGGDQTSNLISIEEETGALVENFMELKSNNYHLHNPISPLIMMDGTIICGSTSNYLFAVYGNNTPSKSTWPVNYGNLKRNSRSISKEEIQIKLPEILKHPISSQVKVGSTAKFEVSASDSITLNFQWLKNSRKIEGATKNNFTIQIVSKGDTGRYEVLVSNDHGSIKSNAAILTVLEPDDEVNPADGIPVITKQPKSKTVWPGQSLNFLVEANGAEPMTYQWFQDQVKLVDKNDKSLTITNVDPSKHIGGYTVVVENSFGSVKSDVARLNIITESELYITKKIFTVGDRLVFQAETPMTGGKVDVERSFDFNNWEKVKSVASVGFITIVVNMENDKQMFYRLKIAD